MNPDQPFTWGDYWVMFVLAPTLFWFLSMWWRGVSK